MTRNRDEGLTQKLVMPKGIQGTSKAATRHVIRNLSGSVYSDTSGHLVADMAGMMFPMDSAESYRESAMKWLGDKTELSSKTIEHADYQEVVDYFREMSAPVVAEPERMNHHLNVGRSYVPGFGDVWSASCSCGFKGDTVTSSHIATLQGRTHVSDSVAV